MEEKYTVYVKTDAQGRITAINSSAFLADTAGWTAIDEGYSDKYHHAQGNYFTLPLYDKQWCSNYKIENSIVLERTEEEKEIEISNRPKSLPTGDERLAALEEAMLAMMSRGTTNV